MTSIYSLTTEVWIALAIIFYIIVQILFVLAYVIFDQFRGSKEYIQQPEFHINTDLSMQKQHKISAKNNISTTKPTNTKNQLVITKPNPVSKKKKAPDQKLTLKGVIILPQTQDSINLYSNVDTKNDVKRVAPNRTLASPRRYMQDIIIRPPALPRLPEPQK